MREADRQFYLGVAARTREGAARMRAVADQYDEWADYMEANLAADREPDPTAVNPMDPLGRR